MASPTDSAETTHRSEAKPRWTERLHGLGPPGAKLRELEQELRALLEHEYGPR